MRPLKQLCLYRTWETRVTETRARVQHILNNDFHMTLTERILESALRKPRLLLPRLPLRSCAAQQGLRSAFLLQYIQYIYMYTYIASLPIINERLSSKLKNAARVKTHALELRDWSSPQYIQYIREINTAVGSPKTPRDLWVASAHQASGRGNIFFFF